MPHIDVDAIPKEEFPLYHHWTYDRIYRNDMIKQPDVLMLMYLHNQWYDKETIEVNYNYYEPRCIHESSLSPSIHSILALELGRKEEGYRFFEFATRLDLDNYNRNTHEGLHMTSIFASWLNIVYGYGGVRTDGSIFMLNPQIPDGWKGYTFRFRLKDVKIIVDVDHQGFTLKLSDDLDVPLVVSGEKVRLQKGKNRFDFPKRG